MGKKITEANNDQLAKGAVMEMNEIGDPGPIEVVTENDFLKGIQLEAFMNDILTIIVHPSSEEGALDFAPPQVNGLNQPILRGKNARVKRKYVEALARCRTTKYVQRVVDPTRPENIQMLERTALTYPFSVLEDPHPNGQVWLESMLAQP